MAAISLGEPPVTSDPHARFLTSLAAHLAELLPADETEWMEAHAGACEQCGTLLTRGRTGLVELGAGGVHVPARMLTSFLVEPDVLTPLERELVGRHLKSCADCRQDMEEMARAAGVPPRLNARGASGNEGGGTGTILVLLAAALLTAFMLWRQASRAPPHPSAPPIAAHPSLEPLALGGAPFLVFDDRMRTSGRPAPASDTLVFGSTAVRVQLPALNLRPGSEVLVTVATTAGAEIAHDTLPTEALDRPFELTATIGPWNAGDYVLKVIPDSGRDTKATRVFEFRLIPKP